MAIIVMPRAKTGTKSAVVTTLITAILLTIMVVVFAIPLFQKGDLEVTQRFDINSIPYSSGRYDYQITVTGEVKNTTSETMYNVRFKMKVENDEYYSQIDFYRIDEIGPGEIARVQGVFLVEADYDTISEIEYSINGGSYQRIAQPMDWFAAAIMGVMAIVMWIVYAVSLKQYKKCKNQSQEAVGGNVFGGPITTSNGEVLTNPFAPQAPQVQQEPQVPQAQICPYCGSKVPAAESKCPGCGAKL